MENTNNTICSICPNTIELRVKHQIEVHKRKHKKWTCFNCNKEDDDTPMITVSNEVHRQIMGPPINARDCMCGKGHKPEDTPNVILCEQCYNIRGIFYFCSMCNKKYRDKIQLKQHMRSIHMRT